MSDVEKLLAQISRIGATDSGGYTRLAWTREDAELGEWFAAACAERDLAVSTDRCGNQWAWWGDPDADGEGADPSPQQTGDQAAPDAADGTGRRRGGVV